MNIRENGPTKQSTISDVKFVAKLACEENKEEKSLSLKASEQVKTLQIKNEILKENKNIRRILISFLSLLSLSWLFFTGYEIRQIAKLRHYLPPSVAIAFITTSLATVVGLWAIGLNYFFHKSK